MTGVVTQCLFPSIFSESVRVACGNWCSFSALRRLLLICVPRRVFHRLQWYGSMLLWISWAQERWTLAWTGERLRISTRVDASWLLTALSQEAVGTCSFVCVCVCMLILISYVDGVVFYED